MLPDKYIQNSYKHSISNIKFISTIYYAKKEICVFICENILWNLTSDWI